jgi:hypothetical protein
MSTNFNPTVPDAVIEWDTEPLQNAVSSFIDEVGPHVATLIKSVAIGGSEISAQAAGTALKTGINECYPEASPLADRVIDIGQRAAITYTTQFIPAEIDSCVQSTGNVAKDRLNQSIEEGANLSARHFSSV